MSKSRIHSILAASLEDIRVEEQAAADAAAAAAAADPAAAVADPAVDPAADPAAAAVDPAADPAVTTEDDDAIADPETLEADIADVNEAEAEVQTNSDAVDELEEVHEGLEALALSLESSLEEGGLTPMSANYMQIAFESYANRLGEDATVPSLESFGGATSRRDATAVSLESVKDVLARVWEAIKAIVVKVRDAIVNFFKALLSGSEKLRQRAAAVKAKVAKASGNAKNDQIELGSLAAKIAVGPKVEVNNKAVSDIVAIAESALSFDEQAGKALVADFAKLRDAVNSGERVQSSGELQPPKAFSKQITGGVSTDVLPGNVSFSIVVNTGAEKLPTSINKYLAGGWSVTKTTAETKVDNDKKISTLDFAAIGHIAETCLKLADVVDEGNKKISEESKQISKGLKDLKISKEVPEDKVAGVKADMKAFQKRATAQDQATTKVLGWAIGAGRAYLAIAEKSLAQYGNQTAAVAA